MKIAEVNLLKESTYQTASEKNGTSICTLSDMILRKSNVNEIEKIK